MFQNQHNSLNSLQQISKNAFEMYDKFVIIHKTGFSDYIKLIHHLLSHPLISINITSLIISIRIHGVGNKFDLQFIQSIHRKNLVNTPEVRLSNKSV